MTSDDQNELLNQISKLAGQINRHKNGQISNDRIAMQANASGGYTYPVPSWHHNNRGPTRRGGYSKPGQAYRNRSLILTGATSSSAPNPPSEYTLKFEAEKPANPGRGWVSKTDRHRQLINASIFDKSSQDRTKAIEETRKKKMKQRQELEKYKLLKHFQLEAVANKYMGTSTHAVSGTERFEINVQGIRFLVANNGSKLIRVPDHINSLKSTPKVAAVGPVKFYRSKNGNMYRAGIVKAHRATGIIKKVDEPCKIFSTSGILYSLVSVGIQPPSSCHKGPMCRYIHDPSKVAVCKEYLQKGSCSNGNSCDLSHELTPERTPSCLHFSRGNCSNSSCRYTHVRVSPSALVCRSFGTYGYCQKGTACMERHVNECPEFSNTGKCNTRGCKLPHREKASLMRNQASRKQSETANDETTDISSDDDDNIDSDDYDSEELEEFINNEVSDTEIPMQQDFVHLS
ncbi:Zinc finger CCCH domain-containing protein [Erysiphe neolycopersici]|uniref:Zinc finger CCCH domain-containing protein n=1 Tax=Erysiphe neolycopersici TaxID=212602 RepID=A0A420HV25_9PEZI|nr:Zinc finger CCCH domain-containing protein [Erysiphe neolycopersici]